MSITIAVLLLVTISIIAYILFIAKRYTIANIENFESEPAFITDENDDYTITPFQKVSNDIKEDVINYFNNEWKNKTGITYTEQFINDTWKYPDALYVMTDKDGKLIGTTGLDRQYMSYPFISHIYVTPENRKTGYGEKLFEHILKHAKKVGYKIVRGFCEDKLVPYYEKFGAEKTSWSSLFKPLVGMNLMYKSL
jgi:GNAT superfamily N-acetyltransferase